VNPSHETRHQKNREVDFDPGEREELARQVGEVVAAFRAALKPRS